MLTTDEYVDALTILAELRKASLTFESLRDGPEWSPALLDAVQRVRDRRNRKQRAPRARHVSRPG